MTELSNKRISARPEPGRSLVPKQNSSEGKGKLGSISKQGDHYLLSLFTAGALAVIRYAKIHGTKHRLWLTALMARADEGRRHRARQQDRQNSLGDDGQGRAIQGARRTRGVTEIAPGAAARALPS